jgi:hypothetical protein
MYRFVSLRRIAFALAAVAVLGLAGPVAAGKHVRFKGSLDAVETHTPLAPPFVMVDVDATGKASHLGKFTLDIEAILNFATHAAVGTYEFTAANGDTLTATFTGQSSPTATPGIIYIEEIATITGGTGRFAGATGSFVCERYLDAATLVSTGSFDGTIHLHDDEDEGDDD